MMYSPSLFIFMRLRRLLIPDLIARKRYPRLLPASLLCLPLLISCSQQPINSNNVQQLQQTLAENYPEIKLEQPDAQQRAKQTEALLRDPITPKSAIQLMLLNSPHLQVELARLGVANAARLQAGMIANPTLSLSALASDRSGPWQWDLGLTQSLMELLTRPVRQQQASSEWMATQLKVSQSLQLNIHQLQREYFAAIAAKQNLQIEEALLDAATAKQQLAESLFNAGNISELDYLAHLSSAQEQQRALVHQQEQVLQTQAELNYLLGLDAGQNAQLPEQLPALPDELFNTQQLTAQAMQSRIDIQLAKLQQQQLRQERALIRKEYGLAESRVGAAAQREGDGTTSLGPQVELTLPLFDRGQAKLAIVDAQIASADAELVDAQLHATRDIKKALAQLQHTHKEQLLQAQLTAARQVELAQREVNFMLASPFALLELKMREIELQQEQTSALLSYWQARSQLELALGRSLPLSIQSDAAATPGGTHKNPTHNSEAHKGHQHD